MRRRGTPEERHVDSGAARVLVGQHPEEGSVAERAKPAAHAVADGQRLDAEPAADVVHVFVRAAVRLLREQVLDATGQESKRGAEELPVSEVCGHHDRALPRARRLENRLPPRELDAPEQRLARVGREREEFDEAPAELNERGARERFGSGRSLAERALDVFDRDPSTPAEEAPRERADARADVARPLEGEPLNSGSRGTKEEQLEALPSTT